jgi:hypothetical protein
MTVKLTERIAIVGAFAPIDTTSSAWVSKPINMAGYDQVTFLIYRGNSDTNAAVTVEKGTTTSLGTAIDFSYQLASAGTTAFSVLDAAESTAASSYTLVATDDNHILAITVKGIALGSSQYVGVKVAAAGSVNLACIIALCYDARQAAATASLVTAV